MTEDTTSDGTPFLPTFTLRAGHFAKRLPLFDTVPPSVWSLFLIYPPLVLVTVPNRHLRLHSSRPRRHAQHAPGVNESCEVLGQGPRGRDGMKFTARGGGGLAGAGTHGHGD